MADDFPDIPLGYGVPLVDLSDGSLPTPTEEWIEATASAAASPFADSAEAASAAATAARDEIVGQPFDNDRDNGQGGIMFPTAQIFAETSATMTSGRVYLSRGVPTRNMSILSIAFELVANASTNDPVEVGILNSTGTVKIATSGSVTGYLNTGAGIKTVPLTAAADLVAGDVYYAFWITVAATTSASVRRATVFADLFGSGIGVAESMGANSKTLPLAVPVTSLVQNDVSPFMGLKESL